MMSQIWYVNILCCTTEKREFNVLTVRLNWAGQFICSLTLISRLLFQGTWSIVQSYDLKSNLLFFFFSFYALSCFVHSWLRSDEQWIQCFNPENVSACGLEVFTHAQMFKRFQCLYVFLCPKWRIFISFKIWTFTQSIKFVNCDHLKYI